MTVTTFDSGIDIDIEDEDVAPDAEQTAYPPSPLPDDRFYVSTDERDAGGVFLAELLEMEDRRAFGWPCCSRACARSSSRRFSRIARTFMDTR